jgi:hypothetical protein
MTLRTRPGTREKLRLLAALRKKPMGVVLADMVAHALAQALAKHKPRGATPRGGAGEH